VFTTPDDSILGNKMALEGMETDKAASLYAATVGSGDISEETQQQQLEQNAKVEIRRQSPHALLPVRPPPQAGGAIEEFSNEGSSRGSRSSGEFMISGDEFGGHSKSQDKGKGKLVDDDDVSTSAVAGVISDRIGGRDEGGGDGLSSDGGRDRNASSGTAVTTTMSTRTDGENEGEGGGGGGGSSAGDGNRVMRFLDRLRV
jgi:hypothetical protein